MKIGEVSDKLGMPASTIRYYEQVGLIDRQRRVSGRRQFDERAIFALEFVRLAQAAGFTIAETKSLLEAHAANPGPAGVWVAEAHAKREHIRRQIRDLRQMERVLAALLSCECATLGDCLTASRSHHAAR